MLLVGLAACGSREPQPDAASQREREAIARMDERTIEGRYAVSATECETGWWDFAAGQVDRVDGLHCLVQGDTPTPDSKRLTLACTGEGTTTTERWTVRFPAENRLSISRDGAPAIKLTRCRGAYSTIR